MQRRREAGLFRVPAASAAADSIPGAMVYLVGAGAVLACIQLMETMNAAKATFGFEGLGDDEYEFDFVSLKVVLEPALTSSERESPFLQVGDESEG